MPCGKEMFYFKSLFLQAKKKGAKRVAAVAAADSPLHPGSRHPSIRRGRALRLLRGRGLRPLRGSVPH
jgi:hypothetical protein